MSQTMRSAAALSTIVAAVMLAVIAYAVATGSFFEEGSVLWGMAWGKVTLIDLYAGFSLFAAWVVFREASRPRALLYVVLIATLGNLFAALYVLVALWHSRGDWSQFWMGHRAPIGSRHG